MRRAALWLAIAAGTIVAGGRALDAQAPAAPATSVEPVANASVVTGGKLHGVVKSGNIPLPGVTVTAQNTLTGKKFSTTTDITGAWSMNLPQNGRYVVRTQFAAFAQGSGEALLNAANHDQAVNFDLTLASRAAAQEQREQAAANQQTARTAIQQLAASGAGNVSLMSALSSDTETGLGAAGASGAELPSAAANTDFSSDSVAISGQSGQVSPMAGMDIDRIRDAIESYRAEHPGQSLPGEGGLFSGGPGGGFGGGGFGQGGGFGGPMMGGGPGGGGFGGGGGRHGNFRGFNPGQPHGAIAWDGTNSALNAQPFSLRGQQQEQPANGTNRFTISFMSAPYLPHFTKPSGKDTVFLSLSGQRNSTPQDFYENVPTLDERGGNFSAAGLAKIYDPATHQQYTYNGTANVIPPNLIASPAKALLNYYPLPNLTTASATGNYNYHLLTTQQSNTTQAGVRYMRSLGKNATMGGFGGRGGGFGGRRGGQSQGLRQSINGNFNWSHSASDSANFIPILGGKSASDQYSVQAGYTIGYNRLTNIFNLNWNRTNSNTTNFFTNGATDPALAAGISVPDSIPLNYGLPSITLSNLDGMSETQPSLSVSQTISATEVLSWMHKKHFMRFGGDYRRVHRDFLSGSPATGRFTFTGLFTEDAAGDSDTGASLADFLLGYPQSTALNAAEFKSYLRDNIFAAYAMDDWRILPSLTLNYGVRWEFYAPYTEKNDHLSMVATSPSNAFASQTQVTEGTPGYPSALVNPYHKGFAPRVALAWRVPKAKQTVVRAGFGMNYTVGEYATFASNMAIQPPFTNEQTNTAAVNGTASTACIQTSSCFTLAKGFSSTGAPVGNYAVDPDYGLPYVMAWNLDVQKTLPLGLVMNLGYNGSRSNHLNVEIAPRALPSSPNTNPTNLLFTYDEAEAFYKMNAGTVRVNKRLSNGVALGANYQYMHAIDDASSVNGSSVNIAQDWTNIAAETGHSGQDVRHQVSGTYLFELPFGPDKYWVTTGVPAHVLEGLSVSGSFNFASGSWLSPTATYTTTNVECGTAGALRPDVVAGQSISSGGGSLHRWFNTSAFTGVAGATCSSFGTAPRNSIQGPGTVTNDMSLSKTENLGDTRSFEIRAIMSNVFNTVQYSGVNTTYGTPTFGQVSSVGQMRQFKFMARFRF